MIYLSVNVLSHSGAAFPKSIASLRRSKLHWHQFRRTMLLGNAAQVLTDRVVLQHLGIRIEKCQFSSCFRGSDYTKIYDLVYSWRNFYFIILFIVPLMISLTNKFIKAPFPFLNWLDIKLLDWLLLVLYVLCGSYDYNAPLNQCLSVIFISVFHSKNFFLSLFYCDCMRPDADYLLGCMLSRKHWRFVVLHQNLDFAYHLFYGCHIMTLAIEQ